MSLTVEPAFLVTVILPDEPPELTPAAARALLRLQLDADAKRQESGDETGGKDPAKPVEPP